MTREPQEEVLFGVHPILEALRSGRRDIDRVLVVRGATRGGLGRVLRQARESGIPVTHLPREVLARKVGRRAVHQGVAAIVSPYRYSDANESIREAASEPDALVVLLEGVEDPRNLGAVLRSARAAGAGTVVLGGEGGAGLTPTVAKTSAGALEGLRVAREPRMSRALRAVREHGFRVVALDPRGEADWSDVDLAGRIVVVAGGEGRGLRPATARAADVRVSIPLAGGIASLNVSVAVGILLFEVVRQRRAGDRPVGTRPGGA